MKILLDSCVWGKAKGELADAGHDVIWAGEWAKDPGDEEILNFANQDGRILVTLDKDFGELVVVHRRKHCGILRLVNIPARKQAAACLKVLALHGKELINGYLVTVEADRMRLRPPEQ